MKQWVLVFITGRGERSIDQGMVVALKNYDNDEHERILSEAGESGIDNAEIIGHVDIPDHIADAMCEGRLYVG